MGEGTQQGNDLSRADLRQKGKRVDGKEEKQVLSHLCTLYRLPLT